MKTVLILLAVTAFASAENVAAPLAARSISSTVEGVIVGIRDEMPCGFPGLGIPPVAPFEVNHKEVNFESNALGLHGSVNNFKLNGLDDFDIHTIKVNVISRKATFRFIFNNVNVDTNYDLRMRLQKAGFTINVVGSGAAKFAIKNMQVWGSLKYAGFLTGKLKLKSLEIRTSIGEVESNIEGILGEGLVNTKLNSVLEEIVETSINENEDYITDTIESAGLPIINNVLADLSISDLVGGGGGGNGDGDGQKQGCGA